MPKVEYVPRTPGGFIENILSATTDFGRLSKERNRVEVALYGNIIS
jgi:hypothetical protein